MSTWMHVVLPAPLGPSAIMPCRTRCVSYSCGQTLLAAAVGYQTPSAFDVCGQGFPAAGMDCEGCFDVVVCSFDSWVSIAVRRLKRLRGVGKTSKKLN